MMELAQLTAATAALIAAVASVISLFRINKVRHEFNSRMTEFLKLTATTSRAQGRREAEEEQK